MFYLLVILGVLSMAMGVFVVGFGVPVRETSFGAGLLVAGTVAITAGFILVGLAATVAELRRVAQALKQRAPNVPRPLRPVERSPRLSATRSSARRGWSGDRVRRAAPRCHRRVPISHRCRPMSYRPHYRPSSRSLAFRICLPRRRWSPASSALTGCVALSPKSNPRPKAREARRPRRNTYGRISTTLGRGPRRLRHHLPRRPNIPSPSPAAGRRRCKISSTRSGRTTVAGTVRRKNAPSRRLISRYAHRSRGHLGLRRHRARATRDRRRARHPAPSPGLRYSSPA